MGREVRRVPGDWLHPLNEYGNYQPLLEPEKSIEEMVRQWYAEAELWHRGKHPDQFERELTDDYITYEEWAGPPPNESHYMPWWPEEQRTHYQMYETTSEGTPISPVMASPEELARWLTDHHASAFTGQRATYEQWLATIERGFAPSAVGVPGVGLVSGVEALAEMERSDE